MIFNSLDFVMFFLIVFVLYYIIGNKYRWILLLISSCIFYMAWRIELIVLILVSSLINYTISNLIYANKNESNRKKLLKLSLFLNFGLLFVFKYMMFINHTFAGLYNWFGWNYPISDFSIILPMGISFYTFQAASYTIDVYRKTYKPQKNYFKLTLYIMFFPQLVAGPIERADRLMPQFFSPKKYSLKNVVAGSKFVIMGFFKKIVIADRVAVVVDTVFNSVYDFSGLAYIIAVILFAFQVYCDFSGYSDIAIGAAKMLDIDLMQNFDKPYFSSSIKEFWRRWHISLSTWFKDYLYIPLGGSRVSKPNYYLNLMITFLASGLWHGANWTFVIWGGLHGFYQIVGDLKSRVFKIKAPKFFSVPMTFVLVVFAWIFFRANNVNDAFYIVANLASDIENWTSADYVYKLLNSLGLQMFEILLAVICIIVLLAAELIDSICSIEKFPFVLRFAYYLGITILIFALGVFGNGGEFIYFQF